MKRAAKLHKKFRTQKTDNSTTKPEEETMKTELTYPEVVAKAKEKGYTLKHNPKAANPYRIGDLGFKYLSAVVEYIEAAPIKEQAVKEEKPKKENAQQTKVEMEQQIRECLDFNRRAPQWGALLKWLEEKGIVADDPAINCPRPTFRNSSGEVVFEWSQDKKLSPKEKYREMLKTMQNLVTPTVEAP